MSKPSTTAGSFRTPLRRARGLGSAHAGTGHFMSERVTWMALIPLLLWAVAAAVGLAPQGFEGATRFLRSPVSATLAVLLVSLGAYHVHLVMKEAIEDYIGGHHRRIALLLLNAGVALLAGALGVISILKVAFSPPA